MVFIIMFDVVGGCYNRQNLNSVGWPVYSTIIDLLYDTAGRTYNNNDDGKENGQRSSVSFCIRLNTLIQNIMHLSNPTINTYFL